MGRILKSFLSFVFIWMILVVPSFANERIAIEISSTAGDWVGKRLVYRIKEEVRRSNIFRLTSNKKEPRIKIYIVTLDPYEGQTSWSGRSTVYSLVMVASGVYFDDIYLTSHVGIAGYKMIKSMAENIIANIDQYTKNFEGAKREWKVFKDFLRGEIAKREQKHVEETEDLNTKISEMEYKINELQGELKKEKAKNWWQKLTGP